MAFFEAFSISTLDVTVGIKELIINNYKKVLLKRGIYTFVPKNEYVIYFYIFRADYKFL
jgi:hypothetical protein